MENEVLNNEVVFDGNGEGADLPFAQDSVLDYSETIGFVDHPFMDTPLNDYTVVEGLLLLIFVIMLVEFFLNLVRRWF